MKYIGFIAVLFPIATTGWVLRDAPKSAAPDFGDATIARFPWSDITIQTGVDPKDIMSSSNSDGTLPFTCPEGVGPSIMDCPETITEWTRMVDKEGNIDVDGESCTSISKACCQAVVCAPLRTNVRVQPGEVTGKMWSPLTIRCIYGGRGGVWHDGEANLYVQMLRPRNGQCPA